MEGLETVTTVVLFVTMIITLQNLVRYLRVWDWNGVAGIVLAFVIGMIAVTWGAHADITAGMHLIKAAPPLGDLDGGSLALLGLFVGSAGPVTVDFIKSRDNSDSAAKPKLLNGGGQGD